MNKEKLETFIQLIDEAIRIAEERRKVMQTFEFYQKGRRGGFGMTRGISEYEGLWADELYEYQIYKSCGAVERYYNKELE